eukprot:9471766-Pyramimonas_sp.AAC.1
MLHPMLHPTTATGAGRAARVSAMAATRIASSNQRAKPQTITAELIGLPEVRGSPPEGLLHHCPHCLHEALPVPRGAVGGVCQQECAPPAPANHPPGASQMRIRPGGQRSRTARSRDNR